MKWMIIAIVEFVAIIAVVVVAINYHDRLIASQNDILVLSGEKEALRELNLILENDKIILQSDKLVLENDVSTLEKKNVILAEEKVVLEKKLKATLPYNLANDQTLSLINQFDVHNPSWSELKSFLKSDRTEFFPFVDDVFVCENFAVMLHDNAERKGIRAGVVFIDFKNDDVGHMINVFYTTDRGHIYIDDTGDIDESLADLSKDLRCTIHYDSVAYLEKDRNYGTLELGVVTSFDYSFYENMSKRWIRYNNDVRDYNNYIHGKTFIIGSAEHKKVMDWSDRLDRDKVGLPTCFSSESMGVVQDFEVRW